MTEQTNFFKTFALLLGGLFLTAQLTGCATATSSLECGVESMHPTVMSAVDSFESAALAIKLSNRVLLEMPISERDSWPNKLYGAPSGAGMFKMGISLLGASQGITVPFEIDPKTGLPRPTSALYIFLKEREQMLSREANHDDLSFFRTQSPRVIAREIPSHRRQPNVQLIDEHTYRNPLMAFGVVTANSVEMVRVQQDLDLLAQGFKQCDAWVHTSREGDIKPAACLDPALKQDTLQARMKKASFTPDQPASTPEPSFNKPSPPTTTDLRETLGVSSKASTTRSAQVKSDRVKGGKKSDMATPREAASRKQTTSQTEPPAAAQGILYVTEQERQIIEKGEELEIMRKNYGKLAGRVYNASVAGADFTTAALVKVVCAIVNGTKALSNIQNEFKGARGVYNLAMAASRVRMIVNAFGYYQQNLGIQFTAYMTMYQQIKGAYPELKDKDPTRAEKTAQALHRIELAAIGLQQLQPKLDKLSQGYDVDFSDDDLTQLAALAELYPGQQELQQELLLAWQK